jgi:H/ACA ribonucleoprotein complex subunit 4
MALVKSGSAPDYTIKPEAAAAPIDTSDWPLLLKNYSDCMQRSLIRSSKYLH